MIPTSMLLRIVATETAEEIVVVTAVVAGTVVAIEAADGTTGAVIETAADVTGDGIAAEMAEIGKAASAVLQSQRRPMLSYLL